MWSQSVGVARWVRPAISMLRTSFSGGLGQEWEYDFMLFLREVLLCNNIKCWFFLVFLMLLWLCPFSKIKLFLVWVCLTTFLCFIIFFLDFIIVFKRINYPVLSWVNPVWVPLVFFS